MQFIVWRLKELYTLLKGDGPRVFRKHLGTREKDRGVAHDDRGVTHRFGHRWGPYCSPEQAARKHLSRQSDIWSWGLSVLQMFVGKVKSIMSNTIESVADALIVENGKVLLVQQKQPWVYGLWGFPGGHLEPGETPQEAVVREIQEELGAKLVQAKLFKVARIQTTSGELELNTFTGALRGPVTLQESSQKAPCLETGDEWPFLMGDWEGVGTA